MAKVAVRRIGGAMSELQVFVARIALGMSPRDAAQSTRRARALAEEIAAGLPLARPRKALVRR